MKKAWFGLLSLLLIFPTQMSDAIIPQSQIKWQLIYVTGNPTCSNYDYQMSNAYRQITSRYLTMYEVDHSYYYSECLSQEKYDEYKIRPDVDLVILVYERSIGRSELNANGVGGVYYHSGPDKSINHTIIFCDCPNFEYSDPTWILTHELSHFVLYYRGFGPEIVENHIHAIDEKYDYCVESRKPELCKDIKAYLRVEDQAYSRVVMAPYIPKMADKSKTDLQSEIVSIQKKITSLWLNGEIDDSDYLNILGYDIANPDTAKQKSSDQYFDQSTAFFTDGKKKGENDIMYHDGEEWLTDEQIQVILSRVPFESNQTNNVNKTIDLPDSFTVAAQKWLDRKINDKQFFVNLTDTVKNITRGN